jgi:hypothetical protein
MIFSHLTKRIAASAAVCLAALLPEHCMSETGTVIPPDQELHCVGRFNFRLPQALRPTGREQSLFLLQLSSATINSPAELAQFWAHARRSFAGLDAGAEPLKVLREFELDGVGPAVWVQLSSLHPDARKLLAMKPGRGHALLLEARATAGREQAAESFMAKVAAGFVPGATLGFCVGHGAFDLPASKNERASASFSAGSGIVVSVETETVSAPDDGQSSSASTMNSPDIKVLSKMDRQAAGLPGKEERVRITGSNAKPKVAMTWIHPGGVGHGLKPRIRLMMSGPDEQGTAINAAWDLLLNSLQQRPASTK